jgi:GntR family transcriptional regulator, galactonate operon transcriptional repressor
MLNLDPLRADAFRRSQESMMRPDVERYGATAMTAEAGLHDAVLDRIGRAIVAGEYAEGSPLDLTVIGNELKVSRPVVREALRVLGTLGMVRAWPKRGTFVTHRSEWSWLHPQVLAWSGDMHDDIGLLEAVAQMREIVEPKVAAIAAERRTEQEAAALQSALVQMASAAGEPARFIEADIQFHRILLAATHNEVLLQVGSVLEAAIRNHDEAVFVRNAPAALDLHRRVAEAVGRRAPADAEHAMQGVLAQALSDVQDVAEPPARTGS